MPRPSIRRLSLLAAAAAVALFAIFAARLLYVNEPEPSDAIVVLNGGSWARTQGGLQWLRRGEAPRLVLDVKAEAEKWGQTEGALARQWIARLPPPEPLQVSVCAINALSTRSEAEQVTRRCLGGAKRVLIVTSAYHTRRARSIFRHIDPSRHYAVAAVKEPRYFGFSWWRHRQWAKTTVEEWAKLIWWEAVDRWR